MTLCFFSCLGSTSTDVADEGAGLQRTVPCLGRHDDNDYLCAGFMNKMGGVTALGTCFEYLQLAGWGKGRLVNVQESGSS